MPHLESQERDEVGKDPRPEGDQEVEEFPELHTTTPIDRKLRECAQYVTTPGQRVTRVDDQDQLQTQEGQSGRHQRRRRQNEKHCLFS